MIYHLLTSLLADSDTTLVRLIRYVTTRSILGFITSFGLCLIFGRSIIHWLYRQGYRDTVRDYGVISVDDKRGTPTMGGIMIIATSFFSALFWCDLSNRFIQLLIMSGIFFCSPGLCR